MTPGDAPFLHTLLSDPSAGPRFRWRGQPPPVEELARRGIDGVLAQWVVELRGRATPLAVVLVTDPDFVNGTAFVSIIAAPDVTRFGIALDGAGAVIDHVFDTWPFRYLYADVADESLEQFRSGEGWLFTIDGHRREAMYLSGRYQDVHHLAISSRTWREQVRPRLRERGPDG